MNSKPTYLFSTGTTSGAIGGRAGADSLCLAARSGFTFPDNSCGAVRAFISINTGDAILDLPTNYGVPTANPIHGPSGIVVDTNWASLMVQPIIPASLFAAGVLPTSAENWWSFSQNTANGAFDTTNHCTNGTIGTSVSGAQGNAGVNNTAWLNNGNAVCSTLLRVLCICY